MPAYRLSGGDGAAYGPGFGPVTAEEVGEVSYLPDARYLLLRLTEPCVIEGNAVRYVLVSPRYVGDTLETLRAGRCTVGIGRVLPGVEPEGGLRKDDVEYLAVGSCAPA